MASDLREKLRSVKTFPSLVKLLRDELDWPVTTDDFDEATFDYTPEELGLDPSTAAKIQEIKRLRPLTANQPWGVFFVKFEPKRLPVVALRRILNRLVVKKRTSANSAERKAWEMDDLMFISSFGEGDERQISFAHFAPDDGDSALPALKVLGWDNLDTALHLDHVAEMLETRLVWPDDDEDPDSWREAWRSAFTLRHREVITTSQTLAIRLAELARAIRDRILTILQVETEDGSVKTLMRAFQKALIHDLEEADFADMYAQTIAYGLLSARIASPAGPGALQLPVTNPFLRELMETFLRPKLAGEVVLNFDELGVSEVVGLLDAADMEMVVLDFGDRNPQEDPVIHFYELFLKEYDAEKRIQRGVFYTPRPIVSFIVRSVDELLRTEFGLQDGLADTTTWGEMSKRHADLVIPEGVSPEQDFIQILDPACGTGTFLVEVIDIVHRSLVDKWKVQGHSKEKIRVLWNEYVSEHLLLRLHGYELLMAPYAIAHLKIGLKLYETGYRFGSEERARVYLTNALELPHDAGERLAFAIPALAHEARAVNAIKKVTRFTVVLGNPPYKGESANKIEWIERSVRDTYQHIDGVRIEEKGKKNWLLDDYVKFLRLSHLTIRETGYGVAGHITNNAFQDNPTFRGLRHALIADFPGFRIADLHGSGRRKDSGQDLRRDQNVFDILQGVCITFLSRHWESTEVPIIARTDLWGQRDEKYRRLSGSGLSEFTWETISPKPPQWYLISLDLSNQAEWDRFVSLTDAMPIHGNGLISAKDHFAYAFSRRELQRKLGIFLDEALSDSEVGDRLGIRDNSMWTIEKGRVRLRKELGDARFCRVSVLPFDRRHSLFHRDVIFNLRLPVTRHIVSGQNLVLLTTRMTKGAKWRHCFVTRDVSDCRLLSNLTSTNAFVFPLFERIDEQGLFDGTGEPSPNFSEQFVRSLKSRVTLPSNGDAALAIFQYIYAVLHSHSYRSRYAVFLKLEFPRIPIAGSQELFDALADLGGELVSLHLLESPSLDDSVAVFSGSSKPRVEKVSYSDKTVWIDEAKTQGFRGVPEDVWKYHIGGYQVCEKWLKVRQPRGGKNPRPGIVLNDEDVGHYQEIIAAISDTIKVRHRVEDVIEQHGGWPDAFTA